MMALWSDLATWRGPTVNEGDGDGHPGEPEDRAVECRGLVIHIAEGSYEGTISWEKNPAARVSSHFVLALDGTLAQLVDTDERAWTQAAGNGHWISVECAGFTPNALTAVQCESIAKLLARCHTAYGVPLQLAFDPNGRGLGHHSMGTNGRDNPTDTWTGPTWGHEDCPGPAIYAQKAGIVARAIEMSGGVAMTTSPSGAQVWGETINAPSLGMSAPAGEFLKYTVEATRAVQAIAKQVTAMQAQLAALAEAVANPPVVVSMDGAQLSAAVQAAVRTELDKTKFGPIG